VERVVLNALAKQTRLSRLTFLRARRPGSENPAPSAISFGIVFREADPPC